MSSILHRAAPIDEPTGRTIHGLAVPYGQIAHVRDGDGQPYKETFAPGSFARSIQERGHKIRLMVMHDQRALPIGRATSLTETPEGLCAEFLVSETQAGNDALTLVRDGLVDSFSIGFSPMRQHIRSGVVVRTEAALREVSLVTSPAYAGALISGVRMADIPVITADAARRQLFLAFEI